MQNIIKQFGAFVVGFDSRLDQILLKIGFFPKLKIITQLIKFGGLFINGLCNLKSGYILKKYDVFSLSFLAFNFARKLFSIRKLLFSCYLYIKKVLKKISGFLKWPQYLQPNKTLYKFLLINYIYYVGIGLDFKYLLKPLLFNKVGGVALNSFYLGLTK